MNLQTGDILHCKGTSLISKIIMKITKSKFSHTALVVECNGRVCIIEAQNNGVNLKSYDSWMKKYNYNYAISRPVKINKEEFAIRAFSKIGVTKYDFKGLLMYQPWYLITGKWKGSSKEANDEKSYCSDYAGWCHSLKDYYKMSPNDINIYTNESSDFLNFNI